MEKNQSVMEKLARLRSQLTVQKTTTWFAKFPMSTEEAAAFIDTALRLEVAGRGKMFIDSSELQGYILRIAERFTKPTAKFGILLCGGVGNGKSSMMMALQRLLLHLEIPLKDNKSCNCYTLTVESAKFIYNQVTVDPKGYAELQETNMLGIDDLGEEETALMNYGNRITPVIDLLSYRYCRMLFTMVTTNLTPAQIRATYGDRIADRFNEMMLILPYRSPSFRTPQMNGANAEVQ